MAAKFKPDILKEAVEALIKLCAPLIPHFAEECWQLLGHTTSLVHAHWPVFDPALVQDDEVTVAVQVSGKLRGTLTLVRDADQKDVEQQALALPNVAEFIKGKQVKKIIIVPNRIVNIVAV